MINETFNLKFAWGVRRQDLGQCADRLAEFLSGLSIIDPVFATLQRGGDSGQRYRTPINLEVLKSWLAEGMHRRDVDNEVIADGGFSVSLTFNEDNAPFLLQIRCGIYSPWLSNICSITFPKNGEAVERLVQVPMLIRIAKTVIQVWLPEEGVISSHEYRKVSPPASFASEAGWITYLPKKLDNFSNIPASARVESVGTGRLVIATDDRFSSTNPDHINFVSSLSRSLKALDTVW